MTEVHLFNFNQDIYGRHLTVWVHHVLRQEKKFESIDQLKQQLTNDRDKALELLSI